MKIIRRIVAGLVGLVAFVALGVIAIPAQASTYPYLWICNSQHSVGKIEVWANNGSGSWGVSPGNCIYLNNTNNQLRIDPDPEHLSGSWDDVDSTWWAYEWQDGYPYCDPGEGTIDPPNYYNDRIFYNTDRSGC